MAEVRVGMLSDIPEDRPFLIETDGYAIGIIRIKDELYAYENRCLHQGGPVCMGELFGRLEPILGEYGEKLGERYADDGEVRIACPWHGWEYDVRTGECVTDRRFKLRSFPVQVRGGEVFVEVRGVEVRGA